MPPTLSTLGGVGSGAAPVFTPADALDMGKLTSLADNQLVRFLLNSVLTLRNANLSALVAHQAPQKASTRSSASASPSAPSSVSGTPHSSAPPSLTAASVRAAQEAMRQFTKALLSASRFTKSDNADVAQLVACVLCDVTRLYAEAVVYLSTAAVAAGRRGEGPLLHQASGDAVADVEDVPFPPAAALDVLRAIAQPFKLVCEAAARATIATSGSGAGGLQRCDMIVERAAASHALAQIVPWCLHGLSGRGSERDGVEVERVLQYFFSSVACASVPASGGTPRGAGAASARDTAASGGAGRAWSATFATEMARILGDILTATNSVTEDQLRPLLQEIIAASPALKGDRLAPQMPVATALARAGAVALSTPGAAIAGRLFLEQMDVIQPAVASVAMGHLELGVEQLMAAEFYHAAEAANAPSSAATAPPRKMLNANEEEEASAEERSQSPAAAPVKPAAATGSDRQEMQRRKRPALREIARAVEVLTCMMELNVNLCVQLVPALVPYLSHEAAEVRALLFRGFVAAWASNSAAFHAYRSAFLVALRRFNDVKPAIRVEALEAAGRILAVATAPPHPWPTALVEEMWNSALRPCVEQRLTDLHVLVRLQAVQTYADILSAIPGIGSAAPASALSLTHTPAGQRGGEGDQQQQQHQQHGPQHGLAGTLGMRTADKNARVRERAVACLSLLYRTHASYFPWIPDCVMNTVKAEGGLQLVEAHVEALLPSPTLKVGHTEESGRDSLGTNPARGGTGAAKAATTLAIFDFEREDAHHGRTYVDAVVQLCRDMQEASFTQFLVLMKKKPQLRLTILRLFEFRARVKAMDDPKSPEGHAAVTAIHRLLTFLQEATFAERGEWDALFRAKDERVARAMQNACQSHITNWRAARASLTDALRGRLEPEVYRFVSESLARQMALPVDTEHLQELLDKIGDHFSMAKLLQRRQQPRRAPVVPRETDDSTAMTRALLTLLHASPAFHPRCVDTLLRAVEAVTHAAAVSGGECRSSSSSSSALVCPTETVLLLLQCLKEWAGYEAVHGCSSAGGNGNGSDDASVGEGEDVRGRSSGRLPILTAATLPKQRKQDVLATLRQLCLGDNAALHLARTVKPAPQPEQQRHAQAQEAGAVVDMEALGKLSRAAAQTFVALIAIPSFGEVRALSTLVETLRGHLAEHAAALATKPAKHADGKSVKRQKQPKPEAAGLCGGDAHVRCAHATAPPATCTPARVVAWLHAVHSLADDPVSRALVQDEALVRHITDVLLQLLTTTGTSGADAEREGRNEEGGGTAEGHVRLPRRTTLAEKREQLRAHVSAASAAVEAAAGALTRIALSNGADRRRGAVSATLDTLLEAYKRVVTRVDGTRTVSSCQQRLAIESQLVHVLVQPSADIGKELAVAVILSAEEEEVVRDAVQRQLTEHLLHDLCDMRFAAFLLMTAVMCESRSSYQELRHAVSAVGDHLRQRQKQLHATLSDPAAMQCYLEYTIPFLVLFMSHHTFYESERTSYNFTAFQRVWHLLFDELFRTGTQCAGFVAELLSRIKASDDVIDRTSHAHRVVCDLGSRVMLECLGQRQTAADALQRFPGAVLLPSFFVKSSHTNPRSLLDTVFLDASVPVSSSAPFRVLTAALLPTTTTTATAGSVPNAGGSRSRSASVGLTPQRASIARAASSGGGDALRTRRSPASASRVTADAAHLQLNVGGENEEGGDGAEEEVLLDTADVNADEAVDGANRTPSLAKGRAARVSIPLSGGGTSAGQRGKRRARSLSSETSSAASSSSSLGSLASGRLRTRPHPQQPRDGTAARKRARVARERDADVRTYGLSEKQLDAVDDALDGLLNGLRQPEIAQLRWKAVKAKVEAEVEAKELNAAVEYARDQLRVRYEAAEP